SFDKAVAGFEGTEDTVNSKGVPVLVSFKRLTATNWILAANFPKAEAYAAIDRARRYLVAALLAAIVLSVGVIWFFMKHLTAPLQHFTSHVCSFTGKSGAERFFDNDSGDEIGVLAKAFNGMVNELDKEREALRTLSRGIEQSPASIVITDRNGNIEYVNPKFTQLTQYTATEAIGQT